MRHAALPAVTLLALTFVMAGCEEEEGPPPSYPFTFSVSQDGQPMEGVTILVQGQPLNGATNSEGILQLPLTGPSGARVALQAQCPEGFRPAAEETRRLMVLDSIDPAARARGITVPFECRPEHRRGVIIVRTNNKADLPIQLDGREVARTDVNGVAHVPVTMSPNHTFAVVIGTAANERLSPQNPQRPFTMPDNDEIFRFDQDFEEPPPPRRRRRRVRAAPSGLPTGIPIRIGSHR
ncbi:MAG: hypothetical protein AAF682_32770 [Planctomycetota bacterium]